MHLCGKTTKGPHLNTDVGCVAPLAEAVSEIYHCPGDVSVGSSAKSLSTEAASSKPQVGSCNDSEGGRKRTFFPETTQGWIRVPVCGCLRPLYHATTAVNCDIDQGLGVLVRAGLCLLFIKITIEHIFSKPKTEGPRQTLQKATKTYREQSKWNDFCGGFSWTRMSHSSVLRDVPRRNASRGAKRLSASTGKTFADGVGFWTFGFCVGWPQMVTVPINKWLQADSLRCDRTCRSTQPIFTCSISECGVPNSPIIFLGK